MAWVCGHGPLRPGWSRTRPPAWLLKKGLDEGKDQSYVLYNDPGAAGPCAPAAGGLHKAEVREIAEKQHFINALQRQPGYLLCAGRRAPASWRTSPASIIRQVIFWTRTEKRWAPTTARCGMPSASAGPEPCHGTPVYVCAKGLQANTVTVGPEENLFDRIVYADEVNWIAIPELTALAGHGPHPLPPGPSRRPAHGGRGAVPAGI